MKPPSCAPGSGTSAVISGASCFWSSQSMTLARSIASARFRPEMSQPPSSRSFGWTMGSSAETGACASSPATLPTRTVAACVREPQ